MHSTVVPPSWTSWRDKAAKAGCQNKDLQGWLQNPYLLIPYLPISREKEILPFSWGSCFYMKDYQTSFKHHHYVKKFYPTSFPTFFLPGPSLVSYPQKLFLSQTTLSKRTTPSIMSVSLLTRKEFLSASSTPCSCHWEVKDRSYGLESRKTPSTIFYLSYGSFIFTWGNR